MNKLSLVTLFFFIHRIHPWISLLGSFKRQWYKIEIDHGSMSEIFDPAGKTKNNVASRSLE